MPLPARFARYIAMSASRMRLSALIGAGLPHAIPTLACKATCDAAQLDRLGDRGAGPLGDVDRLALGAELLAEDQELVAAEARDGVAGAQDRLQSPRELDEERVAGVVAQAVVDRLEAVEVEEHQREARRPASAARDRDVQAVEQEHAVRQLASSGSWTARRATLASERLRSIA